MKKEQFLEIVQRSAKQPLKPEELTFLGTIGEAIESAFQADTVTRKKELDEAVKQLGTFEEGKTAADVIRALGKSVDDLEAKVKTNDGWDFKTLSKDLCIYKRRITFLNFHKLLS